MHLKNAWYAAALSENVAVGAGVERRILGEPIALFRGEDGALGAIANTARTGSRRCRGAGSWGAAICAAPIMAWCSIVPANA
jgi:hypothetical protein